jgi:hypothetical protein
LNAGEGEEDEEDEEEAGTGTEKRDCGGSGVNN